MTLKEILETDNVTIDDWLFHHVEYLEELGFDQEPFFMKMDKDKEKENHKSVTSSENDDTVKFPDMRVFLKKGNDDKYFSLEYKTDTMPTSQTLNFKGDGTMHSDYGFDDLVGQIQKIIDEL